MSGESATRAQLDGVFAGLASAGAIDLNRPRPGVEQHATLLTVRRDV